MGKATMAQRCEIIFSPKEGADLRDTTSKVFVRVVKFAKESDIKIEGIRVIGSRLFFEAPEETSIQAVLNAIQPLVEDAKRQ
ncbi:hypothetical protein KBD71_03430 [Candidatus Woesebacteria bacterium]|nr:hypothetical protein [Candidatus Woesebacteria bacterium]